MQYRPVGPDSGPQSFAAGSHNASDFLLPRRHPPPPLPPHHHQLPPHLFLHLHPPLCCDLPHRLL